MSDDKKPDAGNAPAKKSGGIGMAVGIVILVIVFIFSGAIEIFANQMDRVFMVVERYKSLLLGIVGILIIMKVFSSK